MSETELIKNPSNTSLDKKENNSIEKCPFSDGPSMAEMEHLMEVDAEYFREKRRKELNSSYLGEILREKEKKEQDEMFAELDALPKCEKAYVVLNGLLSLAVVGTVAGVWGNECNFLPELVALGLSHVLLSAGYVRMTTTQKVLDCCSKASTRLDVEAEDIETFASHKLVKEVRDWQKENSPLNETFHFDKSFAQQLGVKAIPMTGLILGLTIAIMREQPTDLNFFGSWFCSYLAASETLLGLAFLRTGRSLNKALDLTNQVYARNQPDTIINDEGVIDIDKQGVPQNVVKQTLINRVKDARTEYVLSHYKS